MIMLSNVIISQSEQENSYTADIIHKIMGEKVNQIKSDLYFQTVDAIFCLLYCLKNMLPSLPTVGNMTNH